MWKRWGFLPFLFEQWDFFWLQFHCQSDCFCHIACRHLSCCSHCQETLPRKLSKPNEYNVHTSFILEKKREKRDIKNNPINNNFFTACRDKNNKASKENIETVLQTMLSSLRFWQGHRVWSLTKLYDVLILSSLKTTSCLPELPWTTADHLCQQSERMPVPQKQNWITEVVQIAVHCFLK